MRIVDPPPSDSPWRERPGDDLDGFLTAFFRAELPAVWPAAPEPESATFLRPMSPPRKPRWSSRLALAASVAMLLAGGWMLSGTFQDARQDGSSSRLLDIGAERLSPGKMIRSLEHQESDKTGIRIDVFPETIKDQTGLPDE